MKLFRSFVRGFFSIALLFSAVAVTPVQAGRYEDCEDDYCGEPLRCGAFSIQVKGGVAPGLYTHRTHTFGVAPLLWCSNPGAGANQVFNGCVATTSPTPSLVGEPLICTNGALDIPNVVVDFGKLAKFNKTSHVPYIVGGEVGYNVSESGQVFLEAMYRHGNSKVNTFTGPNNLLVTEDFTTTDHKQITGFIGARYFWGRFWCDIFSPFVGFKFGVQHTRKFNCVVGFNKTLAIDTLLYFLKNTTPAGGLQVGFDACLWRGLSFVFTAEVVASGPRRNNCNYVVSSQAAAKLFGTAATNSTNPAVARASAFTNVIFGETGPELYFPITFGLRYSF